jgi:hypothetical protein
MDTLSFGDGVRISVPIMIANEDNHDFAKARSINDMFQKWQ